MLPFCLINILLSITASLGNFLILIALRKVSVTSLHPPTKLMFQCLAVSDLGVGLISQPLFSLLFLKCCFYEKMTWNVLYIANWSSSIIFCGVSMSTHSTTLIIVREAATTIFYLNSSLNPFLYFWRMKELRQVVKAIIKRVFSCLI
ncbi:unnamed protein product [Porites lobata]|uniref:G-protein coupled receptors family 1 profile domain-containing protein n=1 Tax=Porites lobata TaxID=104759 RepID=A0ABN8R849_9CNID|nr:unnamed protein product [Porites lobata]